MRLIAECRLGHPLHVTGWFDSNGDLRLIVPACAECDGIQMGDDDDDYIERLGSTLRRGLARETVGTGTAGGALPRGSMLSVVGGAGGQSDAGD